MSRLKVWHLVLAASALLGVLVLAIVVRSVAKPKLPPLAYTVGDLRAVHAEVRIADQEVRGERRLTDGERVSTGADGRARLRLDDGTLVAVDGATQFTLKGKRLALDSGRIFVQGGKAARTEVTLDSASTAVSSSAVAFERKNTASSIYCAQGELVLNVGSKQHRVASGETATIEGNSVKVAPEKAFDDWTGGLAVPWAGALGEKNAIPEVRAGNGGVDPGTPLVVRSQIIKVDIEGELAWTRTRTTYFNGSNEAMQANVRLALPAGAILRRVSRRTQGSSEMTEAQLVIARPATYAGSGSAIGLEWAGAGWLRGNLGSVAAGATLDLDLEYAEWLPTRGDRATYRFPMAGGDDSGLVGELSAEIDVSKARTPFISASAGATLKDQVVRYRNADVRPTGDLVVELAPEVVRPAVARAYVMNAGKGEDPYVLVRTEIPNRADSGVTLAVVVDASMSVGAATLETERAVVDAILEGLGPRDSLVVLAQDQSIRPIGPAVPTLVTKASRAEIRRALGALRPGGATDVGAALQHAADILDAPARGEQAGSGMVVYVGDGQPSIGEPDAERIRRLIGRRVGGIPRMSAIAVGAGSDRWLLAKLVSGVGSVYEVFDRSDAARAGASLIAEALEPTLRDVDIDLGPSVDRIYPREAHAALAGSTVSVIGRLRGRLPTRIGFRFRDSKELVNTERLLYPTPLPRAADVPARWASARIEEMAARDEGIESAIALAAQAKLLTPWTSWSLAASSGGSIETQQLRERVLQLSPNVDAAFASRVDDIVRTESTLLEPERNFGSGVSLKEAAEIATRRILQQAASAVRACRDARASVRPEVARSFVINLAVSAEGQATNVRIVLGEGRDSDPVLERCIKGVVESLRYFAAGLPINLTHTLTVPEARASRRTQCSGASKVALPLRKAIWRARGNLTAPAYLTAAQSCELPTWTDRRAFLLVILEVSLQPETRLAIASELEAAGETDAATFIRKETLRRVTSFAELAALRRILMADEPDIDNELDKADKKATADQARLAVVRRFLMLAPHNALARRRLLALLEAMGQKDALFQEIETLRAEPFADAGLLAQSASALRRSGREAESRRAFGELIERAPRDPWTLAYVGDKLRAEGMFDEASAAYASLSNALPNDASVALRMALAHAGAGRLDVATRLLERVTQTGGRGDDGRLGELASITQAILLANARTDNVDPELLVELERRLLQTPLPDVASIIMVQAPPSDDGIDVRVFRERGERGEQSADLDARFLGITAVRIERGDGTARLLLRRREEPGPSQPIHAKVAALILDSDRTQLRLVTRDIDVAADGKTLEMRFDGEKFL